ncbi:MAG: class I SAM-dependent methyltransferase [Steroidobacteraceae bacterium]
MPDRAASGLLGLAERGLLPDVLIRAGIRRLCAQRLAALQDTSMEGRQDRASHWLEQWRRGPVAIHTDVANAQHYEVPAGFFQHCLGPQLKYSGCYYLDASRTLAEAEECMLAMYGERAELRDGQDVLELGCGWGSLTLWMAGRYPRSRITAVSNSQSQREYIEEQCRLRGYANVRVLTCDVSTLELAPGAFDRCVSVEMFEHVRNHALLLQRVAQWLRPRGKLFVHIFAHRQEAYPFETEGSDNWMGRHFFTGGMMPAADTLLHYQRDLQLEQRWLVDGTHYQRTANHWLQNQDLHREQIMPVLAATYGTALAPLWFQRWRMFFMACAELFGYAGGRQWLIAHYRFTRNY